MASHLKERLGWLNWCWGHIRRRVKIWFDSPSFEKYETRWDPKQQAKGRAWRRLYPPHPHSHTHWPPSEALGQP